MSDLDIFYENSLQLRQKVCTDPSLQQRIREVIDNYKWEKRGNNANYCPLEGTGLGFKSRIREHYHPDVEIAVTAYLWAPDIPVSKHLVVVRQNEASITYLVEDFGELVRLGSVGYDSNAAHSEAARIITHGRTRGINSLSKSSMGQKRGTGNVVVYDLDGGASFTDDFDRRGGWFETFMGHNTRYTFLREIRNKLLSPEFSLPL